jgi:hypothetical protein
MNGEAMIEYEPGGEGRVQRVRNPRKVPPTHRVPKARQKIHLQFRLNHLLIIKYR